MSRTQIPLVSIIAICHNHKDYLLETLESIRLQTYGNIECIIIINISSDGSKEIIDNWIKSNNYLCKVIVNESPLSITQNLNLGLSLANGIYFQAISCDDILDLKKIEKQVNIFLQHSNNLAIVYGNLKYIDAKGALLEINSYFESKGWKCQTDLPCGKIFTQFLIDFIVKAPSVLLNLELVKKVGKYDEGFIFEDLQMWYKLISKYPIYGCYNAITYYRILPGSLFHSTPEDKIKKEHINVYRNVLINEKINFIERTLINLKIIEIRYPFVYKVIKWLINSHY